MKKLFVFIFVLLLSSCGQQNHSTPVTEDSTTHQESINPETTIETTEIIGEKITADPGYKQCMATARYSCGNAFINAYAVNNSSTEICEQFGDENLRNACKDMVITETAKKTLDADRCNALKENDTKISCRQTVIMMKWVKNADPTVCSNIESTSTETDSVENLKDRCVIHIINQLEANEKTKWLCGLIINEEAKNVCESRISEIINYQNSPENPANAQ